MDLELEGRVFLVTGGSRGIGRAIVSRLLAEGARVAACARSGDDLAKLQRASASRHLMTASVDVCDAPAMSEFVLSVADRFGRLDGLVANAGAGRGGRVFETSDKDWVDQISMKILSVTNLVQPALPHLQRSDAGRVVVMNGITAKTPEPAMAAVSAARAAVANLTLTLASALAPDAICVNAINIGAIDTDRQLARFKQAGTDLSYEDWSKQEAARRHISFGRFGQPEEVAPIVALCLSPLSSYMTGASIDVHGGYSMPA